MRPSQKEKEQTEAEAELFITDADIEAFSSAKSDDLQPESHRSGEVPR